MEIISKELLSEVLGEEVFIYKKLSTASIITYTDSDGFVIGDINIYELALKCKEEWAYSKGYRVVEVQKGVVWVIPNEFNVLMAFNYSMIVYRDTDIISACEWIYNELNK